METPATVLHESASVPDNSFSPVFEQRKLKVEEREYEYPFLVISKAEDWRPALATQAKYDMPMPGTDRSMSFPMTGISLKIWEGIEARHVIPEWEGGGDPTKEFDVKRQAVIQQRNVCILEAALQKTIPGKNPDEKVAFLNERCPGEIEALFVFIHKRLCNWSTQEQPLLDQYLHHCALAHQNKVVEFKDFDDWTKASESQYTFRMQRATDQYIIEIPIKGLSRQNRDQIMEETKETEPPHVPVWDARKGAYDRTQTKPNRQDPAWLKVARAVHQKRTVMYLERCLPFEIPGTTGLDKYDWLAERLVGDVTKLKDFIETELLSYGSRYQNFYML